MATESAHNSSPRPTKKLKTLTVTASSDEIKEDDNQIEDSNSATRCCGICLSDDNGKAINGEIESCNHYFCFVCIMEWAKVESRCPMCKLRFTTIRRPPLEGVFVRESVVNIPERNQVNDYLGNRTDGAFDPYALVECTICHGTSDDSFLLLCDLCDSASHTFCVGLGFTVPEGDWFCHVCAILRSEHHKVETEVDLDYQQPPAEQHVSISNIVRKADRPIKASGMNARTLNRCRNVHSRICVIRENWSGLRSGSFKFSASVRNDKTGDSSSSSSRNCRESVTCNGNKSKDIEKAWKMMDRAKSSIQQNHDRTKTIAQPIRYPFRGSNVLKEDTSSSLDSYLRKSHQASNRKKYSPMESGNSISLMLRKPKHNAVLGKRIAESDGDLLVTRGSFLSANVHIRTEKSICGTSSNFAKERVPSLCLTTSSPEHKEATNASLDSYLLKSHRGANRKKYSPMESGNSSSLMWLKPKHNAVIGKQIAESDGDLLATRGSSVAADVHTRTEKSICRTPPSNIAKKGVLSLYLTTCNPKCKASSSRDVAERKVEIENGTEEKTSTTNNKSKSEIQSLVKLNLKLLSRANKLEVNMFKEVAWYATHTILAACGFEHRKHNVKSFQALRCEHPEKTRHLCKSTLMPKSCRECFYSFVEDVVKSILSEKLGCCK